MIEKLAILTTTRCDMRCRHCLRGHDQEISDFPLDLLPRLLDEVRLFGLRRVALTGGEPGLHPQFEQMVAMIVGAGCTWGFVTNGQQTRRYLPVVQRYRQQLHWVSLSLDGARSETHDAIRNCRGAFRRVLEAARQYRALGIPLHINAHLNRLNQAEVSEMISLAAGLGARSIHFGGLIPAAHNLHLALDDAGLRSLYEQIVAAKKDAPLEVGYYSSLHTAGGVSFCGALQLRQLTVNSRGEVIFCCDVAEDGGVIGSLVEMPLTELLESWLMTSAHLQGERVRRIAAGNMPEGFDHCAFCGQTLGGASACF